MHIRENLQTLPIARLDSGATLPTVSVVIPIWNDAAQLRGVLAALAPIQGILEIVVGDASTGPECREIAQAAGATVVTSPEPSRGKQMNAAAAVARGDVLLFQHADTEISQSHIDSLRRTMADPTIVGGAYFRRFNPHHRLRRWMEPLIRGVNRSRHATLWGDQSMFVRRQHFAKMGGFAPIPMMEDMEFTKRLRKSGRVELIDPPMWSSARRHKAYGSLRASLEIFIVVQLFRLGVSPERIHRHYYRRRNGKEGPPTEAEVGPHGPEQP
jgi:rSAM/selenodomain-associated transferase 2